jgi:cytochrome c-type biogenesis protein CcmH
MNDETMREVVEQRLGLARQLAAQGAPPPAAIREQMEGAAGAAVAAAREAPAGEARPDGARGASTGADGEAAEASVRVAVDLAPELAAAAAAGHPLFVIARRPGVGGPPLAVVQRTSAELPFEVELSDDDAMIPGRGISSVDEVEVIARISLSGNPIASSGDLWGSRRVRVARDAMVEVTITERTP